MILFLDVTPLEAGSRQHRSRSTFANAPEATITEIDDDVDDTSPVSSSSGATTDDDGAESPAAQNQNMSEPASLDDLVDISGINTAAYQFVEIHGPTSDMFNPVVYKFTRPGGAALPGLEKDVFAGFSTAQQRALFKHTHAVSIVGAHASQSKKMSVLPVFASRIHALFPHTTTIVRHRCAPLRPHVPVLVDPFLLDCEAYPSLFLRDNGPEHTYERHVIHIRYDPGHHLLAHADIDIWLPEEGAHELVFIFSRTPSSEGVLEPAEQRFGMLGGVIAVLASDMAEKYTLVGTDDIPRAALGLRRKDKRRAVILNAVRERVPSAREPAEFINFLSVGEYRRLVGDSQYVVETSGLR